MQETFRLQKGRFHIKAFFLLLGSLIIHNNQQPSLTFVNISAHKFMGF